jgi:hypothetical protein
VGIVGISGTTLNSPALAETKLTPLLNLSQRYDSNVFYSPKEFVPPGGQSWDLVTTLGAGLKVLDKSRLSDTEATIGVNGNAYAFNTDLAYVSTNVFLASDMTDWAHQLVPGLKLRLSDAFLYTPEPPAFLTGGSPAQSDVFARGIQAYRANTFSNTLSAQAGYSFSRSVGMRANYAYSIYRIGQLYVTAASAGGPAPFTFFDTTIHTASTGPTYTFDGGDTLFVGYTYQKANTTDTEGLNPAIKFTSHSIQPEYATNLVRGWTATISGGGTLIEQFGSKTFFSGRFALTNDFDRRTRVSISASRQAAPAFFIGGGAMISNVAQVYVSHAITRVVRLTVSGNYAHNESTPVNIFTIETMGGSAVLEYNVTRSTKLSLSQEYAKYNYTATPAFDRYATTLTLSTEWK